MVMHIPELRLKSGEYSVNIVLFDLQTGIVFTRIDYASSFIMGQHIASTCDTFQAADWDITYNHI